MSVSNVPLAVRRARLLNEVPPFRPVAVQLLNAVADVSQPLARVVSLLRTDAVLTAEVLRLANSGWLATSVVPDRKRIAPYHDALVINEYQVTQVLEKGAGWNFATKIESSTKIRVAQWGMIDEKPTAIAGAKISGSFLLP